MLFAGLKRESPAAIAAPINRLPDDAARNLAHIFLATGEDSEIRPAVHEVVAETLALGDGDISPVIAGALQESETNRIETHDKQGAFTLGGGSDRFDLFKRAEKVRMLHNDAGREIVDGIGQIVHIEEAVRRRNRDEGDLERRQVRRQDLPIFRMQALGHDDTARALRDIDGHHDSFGDGTAAVVKTGVGDIESRELANQRLGRVGGVELAAGG